MSALSFIYVIPLIGTVRDVSSVVQEIAQFVETSDFNISMNISQIILTTYDIVRSSTYGLAGKTVH